MLDVAGEADRFAPGGLVVEERFACRVGVGLLALEVKIIPRHVRAMRGTRLCSGGAVGPTPLRPLVPALRENASSPCRCRRRRSTRARLHRGSGWRRGGWRGCAWP